MARRGLSKAMARAAERKNGGVIGARKTVRRDNSARKQGGGDRERNEAVDCSRAGEKEEDKCSPELGKVDIVARGKECVLLMTDVWPQLVAWYPEEQEISLVSNTSLPLGYIPSASSPTLLCGFYGEDIMCQDMQEWAPSPSEEKQRAWYFRVAVCSLVTDFQLELPVVRIPKYGGTPYSRLGHGQLRLRVSGDQEHFKVHLLHAAPPPCIVFTYDSHSADWSWTRYIGAPGSRPAGPLHGDYLFWLDKLLAYDPVADTFDAIPYPGGINVWNEYPVPQEFAGYEYRHCLEHFRYRGKLMAFGECWSGKRWSDEERTVMVIVELEEEVNRWKVVSAVDTRRFKLNSETSKLVAYQFEVPLVGDELLVKPSHTKGFYQRHVDYPVVFHLRHSRWLEPPPSALTTFTRLQSVCVYDPTGSGNRMA